MATFEFTTADGTLVTPENVFELVHSQKLSTEEYAAFSAAKAEADKSEVRAETAKAVHFGVSHSGAVAARGIPGTSGQWGVTLYAATIGWFADPDNVAKLTDHVANYGVGGASFTRGSDGRVVHVTRSKAESDTQRDRCRDEIGAWITIAKDRTKLMGEDSVTDSWATTVADLCPELGGAFPCETYSGGLRKLAKSESKDTKELVARSGAKRIAKLANEAVAKDDDKADADAS